MVDDLTNASIEFLAPKIRAGQLSPVDLVEGCLNKIKQYNTKLLSFIHISDTVIDTAQRAEKEIQDGNWKGPLHGIPIAIKDNYQTADMPTKAGTELQAITFPQEDSHAVSLLRKAGAILIGKTRLHEFAWGTVTPPTCNPWNLNCVPGGSSGGSAVAVLAGFASAAMGSDTGGSIRIPASLCGIVGLKPTFGLIGRSGIVPHSWSLDHAGPLTRTVADTAIMLNALAGFDSHDPASKQYVTPNYTEALEEDISGLRIGVCRNHFFGNNQLEVEDATEKAINDISNAGATICEIKIPNLEYALGAIFAIELASSTAYHDASLKEGLVSQFSPDVRTLVELGRFVTGPDYLKAEQFRQVLINDFGKCFLEVDAILAPTTPLTAWKHQVKSIEIAGELESVLAASWRLTYPFNLIGFPAISIPNGFDSENLPIGLQIIAKPFDEATVLRIANFYEKSHDLIGRKPSLHLI